MKYFSILTLSLLFTGPAWADPPPAKPVDPDHAARMARGLDVFKKHVRPVLTQKCVRCHGGKETESHFDLTDRDALLRGGESGPAVLFGRGKESLLYKLIAHVKEPHMPHNSPKLPDDAIAQIATWIDLGAPYDEPLVAKSKAPAWTTKVVADDARQFWSFQPLRRPEPPAVQDAAWCRTLIDRFV